MRAALLLLAALLGLGAVAAQRNRKLQGLIPAAAADSPLPSSLLPLPSQMAPLAVAPLAAVCQTAVVKDGDSVTIIAGRYNVQPGELSVPHLPPPLAAG